MNPKAEALAAARGRILELQAQMSDRILKMAVNRRGMLTPYRHPIFTPL